MILMNLAGKEEQNETQQEKKQKLIKVVKLM
jgi:hypothetical protein